MQTSRAQWTTSIAFRLPAALGMIALVAGVLAVAAIFALDRARLEIEANGARTFDSLATAALLSREAGQLLSSAPFLINTTSAQRVSAESRAIGTRIDALMRKVATQQTGDSKATDFSQIQSTLARLKADTLAVAFDAEAASKKRDELASDVLLLGRLNAANNDAQLMASGLNQIVLNAASADNLIQLGELKREYLEKAPAIASTSKAVTLLYERLFESRQAYLIHVHSMRHALSRMEINAEQLTTAVEGRTLAVSASLAAGIANSSASIRSLQVQMVIALFAVLGVCAAAVIYVVKNIARPLGAIANAMANIPDNENAALAVRNANALELKQLIDAFTAFKTSLAQRNREQARAQRLDALMDMTSQLNHEIGNIIGIISGTAAMIEHDVLDPKQARRLTRITKAAERGRVLVSGMLAFASHQVLNPEKIDACHILHGMADILELAAGPSITVKLETAGSMWINVDPAMLEQSLLNLVLNARDAMPKSGTVTISVTQTSNDVVICVEDTGTGMSVGIRERAFEPYFTTKAGKGGTGLGLPVVYGFARQSDGSVDIESVVGNGTSVTLRFPAIQ